jgi:hypothetical protein
MYIIFLIAFNNILSKNFKKKTIQNDDETPAHTMNNLITPITSNDAFERLLNAHTYLIAYAYTDEQKENNKKIHLEIHNTLEQLLLSEKQYSPSPLRIISINLSLDTLSNIQKDYNISAHGSLLLFYKKDLIDTIDATQGIEFSSLENSIIKIFNNTTHISKKRIHKKLSSPKKIKKHTKVIEHYSFPRVGVNMGWGTPFYDWPGYWYGSPYGYGWSGGYGRWGGYGYGRPSIGVGMSFYSHGGGGGGCGGHIGGHGRR